METREVIVANTKTQKKYKITTDATTLGELQQALTANGIDYSGMSFTEGISRVKLLDPQSTLPQNQMYKGQLTNNLVILLTNTADKVSSGAGISRQEAYAVIKANNLQEAVKEAFGRNFTQVPTSALEEFINSFKGCQKESVPEEGQCSQENAVSAAEPEKEPEKEGEETEEVEVGEAAVGILLEHIGFLHAAEILELEDLKQLSESIQNFIISIEGEENGEHEAEKASEKPAQVEFSDGSLSKEDINDIINGIV